GRFGHHLPDQDDELTADARAAWSRADATMALDLPGPIAELAPGLQWVQAIGAGIDHLGDAGLPDAVTITNAAGAAPAPIPELAISRRLSVWKRLPEIEAAQVEHSWSTKFGTTVEGLTMGVIGLGAIGSAVAVRARAFGMYVIGTRRSYKEGQDHPAVDE